MQNTIFTIELPFVKTDEELEKVKGMYPKYDPYFITSGCCKERRIKFDKLWQNFKPYADSKFLSQIITKPLVGSCFHQGTWEMYIGNVLLEKKLRIQSQNEGPDFIINKTAYVECVAPTKGETKRLDSVSEMFIATKPEEIRAQNLPVDKIILRITGSIKNKAKEQYENWKSKDWFNTKMPFVIAVNTGDLAYLEDPIMPNVLKALFGFQFLRININTGATSFSHRDKVNKSNNEYVPVNCFTNESFSFVSGVLFSDNLVLNHPKNIGEDCIFVNNPFADNPVKESFIKLFKNWTAIKEKDKISLKKRN